MLVNIIMIVIIIIIIIIILRWQKWIDNSRSTLTIAKPKWAYRLPSGISA